MKEEEEYAIVVVVKEEMGTRKGRKKREQQCWGREGKNETGDEEGSTRKREGNRKNVARKFHMASCVGTFHFLASLLFLALVIQKCPLAKGDQGLINNVCSKTGNNSRFCLDCFKRSLQEDIRGLAIDSVLCASSKSFNTRQETSDLSKNATGQFKQNLNSCVGILDDTLLEYANALQNLGIGHFSDAKNQLNLANNKVLDCLNLLSIHVLPLANLPSYLVKDFATLKGDTEVAINVVSQVQS
ncbi:hypothetical protein ACH5RR_006511 [Cinchona calisaya]|uniref:Pectinesterase inhibitor domain-containing protein n=1 Tax=Cinchona calisaya TaxID=153742 RepID=A0ABD3AP89_9GENT